MQRGESVWASHKGLLGLMWKDKKPVYFLSSAHDAAIAEPIPIKIKDEDGQYKEIYVNVPVLVKDYDQRMGGVAKQPTGNCQKSWIDNNLGHDPSRLPCIFVQKNFL